MMEPINLHKFIDQEYHREDAIGLGDDDDPLWVVCGDVDDLFFEANVSMRVHELFRECVKFFDL